MIEAKQIIRRVKPPCPRCPYKLGTVKTVKNPCPECKMDGYKAFDRFNAMANGAKSEIVEE